MFNFLKKNSSTTVATSHKTNLNVIAEKYVEEIKVVEPEISEGEQIAKNKKIIDFLQTEKSETNFQNEKSVFDLEIQKRHDENKVLAMIKEQRKFDAVFLKIDLSFLSMKKKNPVDSDKRSFEIAPKLPAFSYHQLSVSDDQFHFEECQILIEASKDYHDKYSVLDLETWGSHELILKHIQKAFSLTDKDTKFTNKNYTQPTFDRGSTRRDYKMGFRNKFNGMIPRQTKQKLENAVPMFSDTHCSNIFLIKECESWEQSEITKDPLIIGIIGDQAYLIDHFDCTDMEAYVNAEFTS